MGLPLCCATDYCITSAFPALMHVQHLRFKAGHRIDLMQTRCDSLVLWLTLGQAAGAQVPGGEAEALRDDAATAGALGQRQMDLRRRRQHKCCSGQVSTTFTQLQTSLIRKVLDELDGCCKPNWNWEFLFGWIILSGQKVLETNNEGNEIPSSAGQNQSNPISSFQNLGYSCCKA